MANPSKSFMHTPLARPKPAPTAERDFIQGRRTAKRFTCKMDPELHERLKDYAWHRQVTMSQLVNQWVEEGLAADELMDW